VYYNREKIRIITDLYSVGRPPFRPKCTFHFSASTLFGQSVCTTGRKITTWKYKITPYLEFCIFSFIKKDTTQVRLVRYYRNNNPILCPGYSQSVWWINSQRGDLTGRFTVGGGRHARQTCLETGWFLLGSGPDPDQRGTVIRCARQFRWRFFRRTLGGLVQALRVYRYLERLQNTITGTTTI